MAQAGSPLETGTLFARNDIAESLIRVNALNIFRASYKLLKIFPNEIMIKALPTATMDSNRKGTRINPVRAILQRTSWVSCERLSILSKLKGRISVLWRTKSRK